MKHIRFYALVIIVLASVSALSQNLSLTGDNYLILNGERFANKKINFIKAQGDWFTNSNDSHGTIALVAPYNGLELHLDLEWDGKNEPHIINDEIRHLQRKGEFFITMPDKAVYGDGLNSYTSGDDVIEITVIKIDDMNVSLQINGAITEESDKVKVSGVFNLKKSVLTKRVSNSSYKECDNMVYDKLIGAEGRSPSECEAKFDLDVRTVFHDALSAIIEYLKNHSWGIQEATGLEPLTIVGRGSEKNLFRTNYDLRLRDSGNSAQYASFKKQFDDLSAQLQTGNPSKEKVEKFTSFMHQMNGALSLSMSCYTNFTNFSSGNYKGQARVTRLSPNIYKIQSPYVTARTGGGEDNSIDATFLLIGNWKPVVISRESDGGESIRAEAILKPGASHLQVQNIVIRIEAGAALADEVIRQLDLHKLQALIAD